MKQEHKEKIQKVVKFFSSKRSKKDFRIFLLLIATVMIRRGLWGLMDIYLFPNNEILSFILSMLLGVLILVFTDSKFGEIQ